jgi:hypothetical protein
MLESLGWAAEKVLRILLKEFADFRGKSLVKGFAGFSEKPF